MSLNLFNRTTSFGLAIGLAACLLLSGCMIFESREDIKKDFKEEIAIALKEQSATEAKEKNTIEANKSVDTKKITTHQLQIKATYAGQPIVADITYVEDETGTIGEKSDSTELRDAKSSTTKDSQTSTSKNGSSNSSGVVQKHLPDIQVPGGSTGFLNVLGNLFTGDIGSVVQYVMLMLAGGGAGHVVAAKKEKAKRAKEQVKQEMVWGKLGIEEKMKEELKKAAQAEEDAAKRVAKK